MNTSCYSYKSFVIEDEVALGEVVDCCYILCMEGSERLKTVMDRLAFAPPCKNVIIQLNKGFKKCNKPNLKQQKSNYDLTDAYYHAFNHYNNIYKGVKKYQRVLVLEDDFVFTPIIKEKQTLVDLKKFLSENKKVDIIHIGYFLGINDPRWLLKSNNNFRKMIYAPTSHTVIYCKSFIDKFTKNYSSGKFPYDHFDKTFSSEYSNIWVYNKPLGVQAFVETENSSNWNIFGFNSSKQLFKGIEYFNLNKPDEPNTLFEGFKNVSKVCYITNLVVWTIILVLLLLLLSVSLKKLKCVKVIKRR